MNSGPELHAVGPAKEKVCLSSLVFNRGTTTSEMDQRRSDKRYGHCTNKHSPCDG